MNTEKISEAAAIISKANRVVAFTGAGMSAESGIPPFRGEGGIWNQYDPNSLELDFYMTHTDESWKVIKEVFYNFFNNHEIKPNPGHLVLAEWEKKGFLKSVITQNIDDLHRIAGNKVIREFHGNSARFVCTRCGHKMESSGISLADTAPHCPKCSGLMKPDFIFFGEGIPSDAYQNSVDDALSCDVFVIIGTSGQVSPANTIPVIAKRHKAKIIEINKEPSTYTNYISDIYIDGKSGEVLPKIDEMLHLVPED